MMMKCHLNKLGRNITKAEIMKAFNRDDLKQIGKVFIEIKIKCEIHILIVLYYMYIYKVRFTFRINNNIL